MDVIIRITKAANNFDVGKIKGRKLNASIKYSDEVTANYGTFKNIDLALFLSNALKFTISDSIEKGYEGIDVIIKHKNIVINKLVAEHLATWYASEIVINSITFEHAGVTSQKDAAI